MEKRSSLWLLATAVAGVAVGGGERSAAAGTTYQVGQGKPYATISALPPLVGGDVVEIFWQATPYGPELLRGDTSNNGTITFRGVSSGGQRPVFSGATAYNPNGKLNTLEFALTDRIVLENVEVVEGPSRCIYVHAADITIRDTLVHQCPKHGIHAADTETGNLTLERVELHHCGAGDQKHPIYIATDNTAHPDAVFRLQHSYLHDNNTGDGTAYGGGHGVKSRAGRNEIYYNWIEGSRYQELDLIGADPCCNEVVNAVREDSDVVGNVLRKTGPAPYGHIARVGGDDTGESWGRYRFVNNTFWMAPCNPDPNVTCKSPLWPFQHSESIEVHNNVFWRDNGAPILIIRQIDMDYLTPPKPIISGSRNWATNGSTFYSLGTWSGNIVAPAGGTPGFTNLAGLDLHPAAGSALVDQGNTNPQPLAGQAFINPLFPPVLEPVRAATGATARRAGADPIDIGAFEGGSAPPPPPPDDPCGAAGNLLPDCGFETTLGGGGLTGKDYKLTFTPGAGEGISRSTANPIKGVSSLRLTMNNQHYAEWRDQVAADLTTSGTFTGEGTIRNNGSTDITVRVSVGYGDSGWTHHMIHTTYTLTPGQSLFVKGNSPFTAGVGNTFLSHWIQCQTVPSCDISWDKAYMGFSPPM